MFEKPFIVKFWEEHPGTPKCCHTCANFNNTDAPYCEKWGPSFPLPEEHAATVDVCDDWRDKEGGMPF